MSVTPWLRLATEPEAPADIRALERLYRHIDRATARWANQQGLACPAGCGRCSATTDPECTPIEAEFAARFILFTTPDSVAAYLDPPTAPPCPLYRADSPYHCTIYPARLALCRLFGYAAVAHRADGWRFRLCTHMPAGAHWQSLHGQARYFGRPDHGDREPPPIMAQFTAQIEGLRPAEAAERHPLSVALPNALHRLILRRQLLGAEQFAAATALVDIPPHNGVKNCS